MARFTARYRQARSPRLVIFWNREFSDEITSEYQDYTTAESRTDGNLSARRRTYRDDDSVVTDVDADASTRSTVDIRSGRTRVNDGRQATANSRAEDRDMELAFTEALRSAGARLVDRTSLMRRRGLNAGGPDANIQAVETRALLDGADLILEVTQSEDPRRPGGVSYQVTARDVANETVLGSFTSSGQPPRRTMPYVAGSSGFVRATPPEPQAGDVGRQLAIEAMTMLASAFR